MKDYKFLLKPAFFIFNLLFATWLVLKIEKVAPSDFGRYEKMFHPGDIRPENVPQYDKYYLKKLADDYKSGVLDSAMFELQLEKFIDAARHKQSAVKK
ncbi:MAG: hypothetical protein JWO09_593 [Bacteroidetes bacterium]|nr:hypothetical protein [Bacteroidota bacterium]